ncbi:MAG: hypothetical protein FNT15_08470 [Sulfurovum sp.]|nr:MAG: hypothetical protein FNT15_08470 [Sulfurovum sp.]
MQRRDLFKLVGLSIIASASLLSPISLEASSVSSTSGKDVVIVGGGFGGLSVAKALKKADKSINVTVLEKREIFMSCPYSNTYLGGMQGVTFEQLTHDYYAPAAKYGYNFVQCEVIGIDREAKVVKTTTGDFGYNVLVLAPGIAYDYTKQFPSWDAQKISLVSRECPSALMPGSEHLALKRQLDNMNDGNIVIVPPQKGKFRCPPAPFERTSMLASYMKQKKIKGKVIVLDTSDGTFAKNKAFMETWSDLYPNIVEYHGKAPIVDVDVKNKTITYKENEVDVTIKYEVCNLMPYNKVSPVIGMAGLQTTKNGFVAMNSTGFQSKTDPNVYVVGDCVGHGVPASGQTAIWSGKRASLQIVAQLNNSTFDVKSGLPAQAANVCYSMVNTNPAEAIMVQHEFVADADTGNINAVPNVPKPADGSGKFRSKGTGKLTTEWYNGVKRELFS